MAIATTTALLLAASAAASAGGTAYAARQQRGAAREAGRLQDVGLQRQEAIEQANERRRREEYDRAEASAAEQWHAQQALRAPYREASNALLRGWAGNRGITLAPNPAPASMPPGWRPGDPSGGGDLGTIARPRPTPGLMQPLIAPLPGPLQPETVTPPPGDLVAPATGAPPASLGSLARRQAPRRY